jgi:hypothetical protein
MLIVPGKLFCASKRIWQGLSKEKMEGRIPLALKQDFLSISGYRRNYCKKR